MANTPNDPNFIPNLTPQAGGPFKQVLVEAIFETTGLVGSPPTAPQDAYKIVRLNQYGQLDPSLGAGGGGGGGSVFSVNGQIGIVVLTATDVGADPVGSAASAQTNAEAYASNASNLSSGTIASARLSGTYGINVSGNAATVTNGVYTSGSYADPSWITSLAGSKISGNISGDATSITGNITYSQVTGVPAFPQNTSVVPHEFFTAYNSTTGAFTQAQPSFSDLSGSIATGQIPASTVTVSQINAAGTPSSTTYLRGDGSWVTIAGGSSAFSAITSGTNTTAAMVVGSGASIMVSGTGAVEATQLNAVVVSGTAPTTGQALIATSPTTANWQTISSGFTDPMTNTGDLIYGVVSGSPATLVPTRLGIGTNGYVLTVVGGLPAWAPASGGGSSSRTTVTITTLSLAAGEMQTGLVTVAKTFALQVLTVDVPARLRLYSSTAFRDADLTRPPSQFLHYWTNHGCICDILLNAATGLTWTLNPTALGTDNDTSVTSSIPYTVTNAGTQAATITLTLTYLTMET
jgi:hypothetical protein